MPRVPQWTPELLATLGYEFADDGTFWMELGDFLAHFNTVYAARLLGEGSEAGTAESGGGGGEGVLSTNPDDQSDGVDGGGGAALARKAALAPRAWLRQSVSGAWAGTSAAGCCKHSEWRSNPCVLLTLPRAAHVFVLLSQPDPRLAHDGKAAASIGFLATSLTALRPRGRRAPKAAEMVLRGLPFRAERDVGSDSGAAPLPAGTYVLVPCTYEPGMEAEFEVEVRSSGPCVLELLGSVHDAICRRDESARRDGSSSAARTAGGERMSAATSHAVDAGGEVGNGSRDSAANGEDEDKDDDDEDKDDEDDEDDEEEIWAEGREEPERDLHPSARLEQMRALGDSKHERRRERQARQLSMAYIEQQRQELAMQGWSTDLACFDDEASLRAVQLQAKRIASAPSGIPAAEDRRGGRQQSATHQSTVGERFTARSGRDRSTRTRHGPQSPARSQPPRPHSAATRITHPADGLLVPPEALGSGRYSHANARHRPPSAAGRMGASAGPAAPPTSCLSAGSAGGAPTSCLSAGSAGGSWAPSPALLPTPVCESALLAYQRAATATASSFSTHKAAGTRGRDHQLLPPHGRSYEHLLQTAAARMLSSTAPPVLGGRQRSGGMAAPVALSGRGGVSAAGRRPQSTRRQLERLQAAQERVLSALGIDGGGELPHADGEDVAASRASWRESVLEAQRQRDAVLSALIAKHRRSEPWR